MERVGMPTLPSTLMEGAKRGDDLALSLISEGANYS